MMVHPPRNGRQTTFQCIPFGWNQSTVLRRRFAKVSAPCAASWLTSSAPLSRPPRLLRCFCATRPAGADVRGTANRTAILKFGLNVSDIDLRAPPCAERYATGTHPFLRGNIGFGSWLTEALDTSLTDRFIARHPDRLTSVGHTFQFVVLATAGINPTFTIAPRPIAINPSLGVSREEDNSVDVVLAKRSSGGGGSTTVAKVKTPEQAKKVEQYRKESEEARKTIAQADAFLDTPDGRRLAQLQTQIKGKEAAITSLGVPLPSGLAAPNNLDVPNTLSEPMAAKARQDFSELQTLKGQFGASGGAAFDRNQRERAAAQSTIDENQGRIQAIEQDPKGVRVTRAPAPARGGTARSSHTSRRRAGYWPCGGSGPANHRPTIPRPSRRAPA